MADPKSPEQTDAPAGRASSVEWNDEALQTTFANVVNIQGTREQIEIFYGTNRTWDGKAEGPVRVDLTNRVIMTPYAAKRMHQILSGVLREYETRHGVLKVDDS